MKQANETTRNAFLVVKPSNEVNVTWLGEDDWDKEPSLEMLQKAVGGCIEVVNATGEPDIAIVVDDEGLLKNYEVNLPATLIAGYPFLCGNAVIMHRDGDRLLPLTAGEADKVTSLAAIAAVYEKTQISEANDGSRA